MGSGTNFPTFLLDTDTETQETSTGNLGLHPNL